MRQPAPRPRHEGGRDRQQQAGPVAGAPVGRDGAAVANIRESLQRRIQDLPRGAPLRVGHEADSTCVALAALVVAEVVHRCPLEGSEVRERRTAWTIDLAGVAEDGAPASA